MIDRTIPPAIHPIGNLTLPKPDEKILKNGITMHTYSGGSQDVNQLTFIWQGGAVETRVPAVATIACNLLREGTKQLTGSEISEMLDFHGTMLRLGAQDHTCTLTATSLNSKTIDILPLIRQIVTEPQFDDSTFRTIREMEEKNFMVAQSNVSILANNALVPLVKGPDNPSARLNTLEGIQKITADEVRDFTSRLLVTEDCHVFLSGKLDGSIIDEVEKMLESIPRKKQAICPDIKPYAPLEPQTVTSDMPDAKQAAVTIGIPAILRSHPDYVPLRFTVMALGGYFGSRLMKNVREDKGYTYGIGAYLLGSREGSFAEVIAQTDAKYIDLLIAEVGNEMRRLVTDPLDDDEMLRLRQYLSTTLIEILDTPFAIMDFNLSKITSGMPDNYFDDQVGWVKKLTPATISEMAAKYLDPDKMRVSVCK